MSEALKVKMMLSEDMMQRCCTAMRKWHDKIRKQPRDPSVSAEGTRTIYLAWCELTMKRELALKGVRSTGNAFVFKFDISREQANLIYVALADFASDVDRIKLEELAKLYVDTKNEVYHMINGSTPNFA